MGFGYSKALWIREASSYGNATDMSTGSQYVIPVRANSTLEKTIARITTEHIRGVASVQDSEDQLGIVSVGGAFGGVVPWTALQGTGFNAWGIILKHTLGEVTTSGPVSTKYTHTFTWNDLLFVGLSIADNKAGATYAYHGIQIESLNLTGTIGGPLEFTCNVLGASEVVAATITAPALTLLSAHPYVLCQKITFELDDTAQAMTGFDITFANELEAAEDRSYALGSDARALLVKSGHSCTGTLRRRHDADGTNISLFYTKFLSGATAKIEIILTHPTDTDYTAKINLGHVKFTGKTPNAADKGYIPEEIPFTAFNLDNAASFIEWTDEDDLTTAAGAYTGAGA